MKRVKSRNESILDLTAPLTEKSSYKVSSQGKDWGPHLSFGVIILPILFLKWILGEQFPERKKENWSRLDIQNYDSLTLDALSYLHVETSLGGSRLKPGTVSIHGWEERGSPQVIQLSET